MECRLRLVSRISVGVLNEKTEEKEMFQKRLATTLVAGIASLALPAFSQTENPGKQDVAVQAFGSFVTGTTQDGVRNSATDSGGVLASYRYFFSAHHGVEANYGYALNTQNYSSDAGVFGVNSYSHEVSGAYVFRMPFRRVMPFALAGAGALIFDPKNFTGASTQTRAAFVYGAGADVNLSNHIFMRAEYRGFVYSSPTYDLPTLAGLGRATHRAEPSVGFGYRF
jgi:opacity protein-like surface antigen